MPIHMQDKDPTLKTIIIRPAIPKTIVIPKTLVSIVSPKTIVIRPEAPAWPSN